MAGRWRAVVKAEFGSLTFKREQLSQATLQRLDILSGDPQKLVARIAELEATVDSLRRDNAVLREQLLALKQRLEAGTRSQLTARAVIGGEPTGAKFLRVVHMSAAKDALLDLHADILCLQEVQDWDSVAELISVLPGFQPLVVSRFREFGSSGPVTIQQTAIA